GLIIEGASSSPTPLPLPPRGRSRDLLYFKRLIQIPKLPEVGFYPLHYPLHPPPRPSTLIGGGGAEIYTILTRFPVCVISDSDLQIEKLKQEVEQLRAELEAVRSEAQRYITQLKAQINTLETELEETRKLKQKALVDNEELRVELEKLRGERSHSERAQLSLVEAEKKVQANEQRYNKLKEKHSELVKTHAELLRKVKPNKPPQWEFGEVSGTFFPPCLRSRARSDCFPLLRIARSRLKELATARERAQQAARDSEAEVQRLSERLEEQDTSLRREQEQNCREVAELRGKLGESQRRREQRLTAEQWELVCGSAREAQAIVQDALATLSDPLHVRCTSSPDYLISRAEAALDSVASTHEGLSQYLSNRADAGKLVQALARFAHLTADTIVNGSATAHLAPTDPADKLTDGCRECGAETLRFLGHLKDEQLVSQADLGPVRGALHTILQLGQELRPRSLEVGQGELGDMVDTEMAATSAAIDAAVRRIEVPFPPSLPRSPVPGEREGNCQRCCGYGLEFTAIRQLVVSSTSLQKEIVESGRGAATTKEFYAKNSRWTEGLISASKAVGWGATQLVDSADKVVLKTGKYEELIVCSHEVAASTAQLVAASKVKADRSSRNLNRLQQASRQVNEMAAKVVASTKSGQEQIEDRDTMDFSGMSRIKLKKQEIESQVKVLELENKLELERLRLGELRKKHYDLGGAYDNAVGAEISPEKPSFPAKPLPSPKPIVPPKSVAQVNSGFS
uniref:Huntingtin interacting protein 1 related b n=1 Tax=Callorhinchus milii TaxID=7868 RepID=A0A4W3HB78_CALMI